MAIVVCLVTGILFGFLQVYVKYQDPGFALTHWFNDMSYYIKNGFVVLISAAVFLIKPSPRLVFYALFLEYGDFTGSAICVSRFGVLQPRLVYDITHLYFCGGSHPVAEKRVGGSA